MSRFIIGLVIGSMAGFYYGYEKGKEYHREYIMVPGIEYRLGHEKQSTLDSIVDIKNNKYKPCIGQDYNENHNDRTAGFRKRNTGKTIVRKERDTAYLDR